MAARSIATLTAAATLVIIAVRPMSTGSKTSLIANPTVSRGFWVCTASSAGSVAKIVACGPITPSVPPDQTIGTCLTSSALRLPLATSTSRNARSARMRVQSLTPPFSLGLADDGNQTVGLKHAVVDQLGKLTRNR